jgi:hypothetical protein
MKEITKKLPVIPSVYRTLREKCEYYRAKFQGPEKVFTSIYRNNEWGGTDSISGTGSDIHQTRAVIRELPAVLASFRISTMLDIPCGDFHWMKHVELSDIDYLGADIVDEVIKKNTENYGKDGVRFQKLNLIEDRLPKVDLVFCRDCFVHLSFADIFHSLDNICNSHSEYLLTTTFTGRKDNCDIATGKWRVLNLEIAPFMLPRPIKVIDEECTEIDGAYRDKALGMWRIADIRESLSRRGT